MAYAQRLSIGDVFKFRDRVAHYPPTYFACAVIGRLRAARHSSIRCTTTNSEGTNKIARQVDAIIPLKTVIPIDLHALAPAPLAMTSGTTPRMKANEVIRIGRRRAIAASTAASNSGLPSRTR